MSNVWLKTKRKFKKRIKKEERMGILSALTSPCSRKAYGGVQTLGGNLNTAQIDALTYKRGRLTRDNWLFICHLLFSTSHEHQVAMSSHRATPRTSKHTSYKQNNLQ